MCAPLFFAFLSDKLSLIKCKTEPFKKAFSQRCVSVLTSFCTLKFFKCFPIIYSLSKRVLYRDDFTNVYTPLLLQSILGVGYLSLTGEGCGEFGQCKDFSPLINKANIFSSRKAVHGRELVENKGFLPVLWCCRVFLTATPPHPLSKLKWLAPQPTNDTTDQFAKYQGYLASVGLF